MLLSNKLCISTSLVKAAGDEKKMLMLISTDRFVHGTARSYRVNIHGCVAVFSRRALEKTERPKGKLAKLEVKEQKVTEFRKIGSLIN